MEFINYNLISIKNGNKCSICKKYLSVVPIICVNSEKYICGRCYLNTCNASVLHREKLFEATALFINFPCSFDKFGCQAKLKLNEVMTHENNCTFQPINCPVNSYNTCDIEQCLWNGMEKELSKHLEDNHKSLIIDPPEIHFDTIKKDCIFLVTVKNNFMSIIIKFIQPTIFKYMVISTCHLYVDQTYEIIFLNKENKKRIVRNGQVKYVYDENNIEEIDLNELEKLLKTKHNIFGLFNFNIISRDDETRELRCPVCMKFIALPNISQTDQRMCNNCKIELSNSPTCKARNYSSESLKCVLTGTEPVSEVIGTRMEPVRAKKNFVINCLLKCGWKGLESKSEEHIKSSHNNRLHKNLDFIWDLNNPKDISLLLYKNSILKVYYKITDDRKYLNITIEELSNDESKLNELSKISIIYFARVDEYFNPDHTCTFVIPLDYFQSVSIGSFKLLICD